ncbi:phosphotransferase [Propionibacteriaceae bacterium Y1685]
MPAATFLHGRRTPWSAAPTELRAWVAQQLGGEIVDASDRTGGMSVGLATVVRTATRSAFVKALDGDHNPVGAQNCHHEARMAKDLPVLAEIPALIAAGDIPGTAWTANVFEAADGRTPDHPWTGSSFGRVLDAWHRLTPKLHGVEWPHALTAPHAFFDRWQQVAGDTEDPWHELAQSWATRLESAMSRIGGDPEHPAMLAHIDLRADNVLLGATEPGVWFIDWAHPALAAPWLDPAILFADVIASGADVHDGGEVDATAAWRAHSATERYDLELMQATVAALAFATHVGANRPPSPLFPHQRGWERAMADGLAPFITRLR